MLTLKKQLTDSRVQMRGLIMRKLDLGGDSRKLGHDVIFDTTNVACLAQHLYALRVNDATPEDDEDEIEEMKTLTKTYLTFENHGPGSSPTPEGHVIVLTGSTGSS